MLNFLPSWLLGAISFVLLAVNVIGWSLMFFAFAILKLICRTNGLRKKLDPILIYFAERYISCNHAWMWLTQRCDWDIQGINALKKRSWYLVSANHLSWADVFVLQKTFHQKIPFIKFFLKRELIYVPFVGQAWWALNMPFMRRYSKSYLQKHPHKKGDDIRETQKACERFSLVPTTVMNFVEGTRLTPEKHAKQSSSYEHLLMPKAGGIAFAVKALGDKFHSLLDVTIVYPQGTPSFWDFLCGRMEKVIVRVKEIEIPECFAYGDYQNDQEFRKQFQQWLTEIWEEKDRLITELKAKAIPAV